ncbi:hypothetical protein XA68_15893 [Ophiocordyceps unilateralis]|uniref:Uncharacterized protein n=1 Tax=Ophiocordyceps unilateralis TaxID=268505 RepID=A0A2A9PPI0_OPHUN|nr:hypothetical protein XA68_15893 [Ophiocordyceps unilateralis]
MSDLLSRKRDKPLRTYGKRPASSDATGEPRRKKLLVEATDASLNVPKTKASTGQVAEDQAPQVRKQADEKPSTNPSIRSYFKPVSRAKKEESTLHNNATSRAQKRRQPRLLRLRTTSCTLIEKKKVEKSGFERSDDDDDSFVACGEEGDRARSSRASRRRKRPRVQTTLNLSSRGTFAECKTSRQGDGEDEEK